MSRAIRRGIDAGRLNARAIAGLLLAMSAIVASYYFWAPATKLLTRYAEWQQSGGILGSAVATMLAGGALSELSLVYFQQGGRWRARNVEDMCLKGGMFFLSGAIVFKFYEWQAFWFGNGATWSVVLPKMLADQLGFTVFWATPYQALVTRWQAARYSFRRLWSELDWNIVPDRMLPILITSWMFWVPGATLIYLMPLILQTPLFVFAIAIWGILLASVGHPTEIVPADLPSEAVPANPAE